MKNSKKVLMISEIVVGSIFILGFIGCLILELVIPSHPLSVWLKEYVWNINNTLTWLKDHLSVIISCLITFVVVYAVTRVIRAILQSKMRKSNRAKTVVTLFDGFVKYAAAIAMILIV